MADAGLFIGWGQVVRGREGPAVEGFNETVEFFGQLQGDGRIESFEICFLDPHGGDLGGFMLLRGEREALSRIHSSQEFERVVARAQLIVENFGVVYAATGGEIERQMGVFMEAAGELA